MKARISLLLLGCLLVPAIAARPQGAPLSDGDWKVWVDEVRPLLTPDEEKAAKKLPAAEREAFRETFWHRRDLDPSTVENEFRVAIEGRVQTAEARFRSKKNGPWNDCGRTWVILGKPDWVRDVTEHKGSAGMAAFRDQDTGPSEAWKYQSHPRLPVTPNGITFQFTTDCEAFGGLAAQKVLDGVAKSYVLREQ
jgi:GWxTD domain-containing protein